MSKSRKLRRRRALVAATKRPIVPKRIGMSSDACLTAKERKELTQQRERRILERDAEWRREARREPEHQPIDRRALEIEVIAIWSRRMMFDILKAIRGKPKFCLIAKGQQDNGKIPATSSRVSKRGFASFMEAFSECGARHEA
jgi:hypothetical protein